MLKLAAAIFAFSACCSVVVSSEKSTVTELTIDNFDSLVANSDNFWIINFNERSVKNDGELAKVAKWLQGIVNVGTIDKEQLKKLSSKLNGIKSQKLAFFGDDKTKPVAYKGKISAEEILEFFNEEVVKTIERRVGKKLKDSSSKFKSKKNEKKSNSGDGSVVILTDQNFDKLVLNSKDAWMVEFFAPWCGHCKRLEPDWKEAAKQLGGAVKFGALDATVNEETARRFGIRGFPTIKYFAPGSSESDWEDYQGDRSAAALASFAKSKAESIAPPPEVVEGINKDVVAEACSNKQLCVFAFLPHILDCQSKCRKNHIKLLNDIATSFKSKPWGWVWVEGGSQTDMESSLGVGGFGYPAVSALSPKKMMFSTMKGSFTKQSISEFLQGISYGKSRVEGVKSSSLGDDGFLKVSDIAEWDGKDGEIPKMEELDLSDIDLDDIKSEL